MEQLIRIPLWVMHAAPAMTPIQHIKDFCQGDVETAIGGGIRNNSNEEQKKQFQSLLQEFKSTVDELQKFIKNAGFKTGVEWNPKGGSIMDAKAASGGGGAAEEKTEEPATKKPAKKAGGAAAGGAGGGMAAVMGDLSKGLDITKGMKKVTKDMKTKNRKDRSGKVTATAPKGGKAKRNKSGAPNVVFRGGRWFVENFDQDTGAEKKDANGVVQVEKADLKSNVFITMCDDTYVQIKQKVKAVTIDNCVKTTVYVSEVVSTVEVVNCKSVKVIVLEGGRVPSFAVDKCESPQIILSKSAFEAHPDIYSSNISAMNVEFPGAKENDNSRECPIPEQFLTKIDPKTGEVTTTATEH
jgi:adenylyl cyclase-associated protein